MFYILIGITLLIALAVGLAVTIKTDQHCNNE